MIQSMKHWVKERKYHSRKMNKQTSVIRGKVQNHMMMDNEERFKNLFIGYSIQASRLMHIITPFSDNTQIAKQHRKEVDQITELMKQIQGEVNELGQMKTVYDKHLKNKVWCKVRLSKSVKHLEQIIKETDALVKELS